MPSSPEFVEWIGNDQDAHDSGSCLVDASISGYPPARS
jgi:hypothetical protein